MAYDTRNGGHPASPPVYSGSSSNPAPRNPHCDPVTVAPGAPPTPQPVAQFSPAGPPAPPPGGGLNRSGVKPLT